MPVKFTKHAAERMQEREITLHDVIRVLAFGEPVPTRRPSVYRSWISRCGRLSECQPSEGVKSVVVVFQNGDHSDEFTVITTYRDERTAYAVRE